jgi:hypothetical protein
LRRCILLFVIDIENAQEILHDVAGARRRNPIPGRYSRADAIFDC